MDKVIVSDSCICRNEEFDKYVDQKIVAFSLEIDGKEYIDDDNMDVKGFLRDMKNSQNVPKSAAPSPKAFMDAVGEASEAFIVTITGKLSGTYQNAMLAKEMLAEENKKVHVVDSMSAMSGESLIAYKLRQWINENLKFDDIVRKIEEFRDKMSTYIVLEDLDNLVKNGRMSKLVGRIAKALRISPVLKAEDGIIEIYKKTRGIRKSLNQIVDTTKEMANYAFSDICMVAHVNDEERAREVSDMIKERCQFKEVIILESHGLGSLYGNQGGIVISF